MENETKMTAAPVKYYVGDLCYVMHDEWYEVCGLLSFDNETVKYELEDGRIFFSLCTKYGDGTYLDNRGRSYSVDAGLIGAIKVEDIRDSSFEGMIERGAGQIVEFPEELEDYEVYDDNGVLVFSDVWIDTAGEEDEEDEDA